VMASPSGAWARFTTLTLAVEIDPAMFESGRHLAAWAGLTPKERSTGGKQRMGGITRAGNERLRVLLVSAATAPTATDGRRYVSPRRLADRRSRIQRWSDIITATVELQAGMPAGWMLPEQQESALAEALRTIVELDLSELQAIEAPRGFGRD
jgi:hypothetical protein